MNGKQRQDDRQREAMSSVDAAWLGMDRPTNLMIINAVLMFDAPVDFGRLQALLAERLVQRFARFRQRIVEAPPGTGRLHWELDPHFDLRLHVRRLALPAPGDTATLQGVLGDLMNEALDHNRPLWRFYLIENDAGGCAIFGRIHHCIADGIALIQVLLSLTDATAEGAVTVENEPPPRTAKAGGPVAAWLGPALHKALYLVDQVREHGLTAPEPQQALREAAQSAGLMGATAATILAKLLVMSPDRPSVLQGELSALKRVVWSEPLPLDAVKAIGRATGTTVNDVLVAAVAGALRRYLARRGDTLAGEDIRAMVPVNLRAAGAPLKLGNQFSLVYLPLPVTVAEMAGRLQTVKRRMDRLKRSPEALLVYQVLNVLGMLPGEVAKGATDWFANKASCVLTNVPGPRQILYFAGQPLRRLLFWVPQSGEIGLGISIISYAGTVTVGVMADEALVPDPAEIVADVVAEFAAMVEELMISEGRATTPG